MSQLINILIRTSNRPALFARCLQSIRNQTFKNIRIIVGYDSDKALGYLPFEVVPVMLHRESDLPFFYDQYCKWLAGAVREGWFFFLDDDDYLHSPAVLTELSEHFTGDHGAIICQFLRNGMPKPTSNYMRRGVIRDGHIGLPSLVLRAEHADKLYLDGHKSGDYRAIERITQQVKTKFIELVVVETDRRSHGNMELSEIIENIK